MKFLLFIAAMAFSSFSSATDAEFKNLVDDILVYIDTNAKDQIYNPDTKKGCRWIVDGGRIAIACFKSGANSHLLMTIGADGTVRSAVVGGKNPYIFNPVE